MTADSEKLVEIANEEIARMRRMALGDWGTAGPDPRPDIVDIIPPPHPCWDNGWWIHATQRPAHPGRVGGPISPFAEVIHTCDMLPEELDALAHNWTSGPGIGAARGACAHFVFGRTPAEGVLQFVPINRNGNHAGGDRHGVFVDGKGRTYHPNTVTIGIEIHCAGGVRRVNGEWRLVEDGKAHGKPLPDADVIQDPKRPGRGWHRVTDYQYERLTALLHDLEPMLAPMPAGTFTKSIAEQPQPWGVMRTARLVTHHQLDAEHRSDPWPPTCDWLRANT